MKIDFATASAAVMEPPTPDPVPQVVVETAPVGSLPLNACAVRYASKDGQTHLLQPGEMVLTAFISCESDVPQRMRLANAYSATLVVSDPPIVIPVQYIKPGFSAGRPSLDRAAVYREERVTHMEDFGDNPKKVIIPFRARWYFVPSVGAKEILDTEVRQDLKIFTLVGVSPVEGEAYALLLGEAWGDPEHALYEVMRRHRLRGWIALGLPPVVRRKL